MLFYFLPLVSQQSANAVLSATGSSVPPKEEPVKSHTRPQSESKSTGMFNQFHL